MSSRIDKIGENNKALINGFFLTNLSPALNLNSKFTVTSENNVNNYIECINTIQNANNSLPRSVLSENNSYRFYSVMIIQIKIYMLRNY